MFCAGGGVRVLQGHQETSIRPFSKSRWSPTLPELYPPWLQSNHPNLPPAPPKKRRESECSRKGKGVQITAEFRLFSSDSVSQEKPLRPTTGLHPEVTRKRGRLNRARRKTQGQRQNQKPRSLTHSFARRHPWRRTQLKRPAWVCSHLVKV